MLGIRTQGLGMVSIDGSTVLWIGYIKMKLSNKKLIYYFAFSMCNSHSRIQITLNCTYLQTVRYSDVIK